MLRALVTSASMFVLALLLGCPPPSAQASDPYGIHKQEGNTPLEIVNKTASPMNHLVVTNDTGTSYSSTTSELQSFLSDDPKMGASYAPINPGESRTFKLKPGKKKLSLEDHPSNMSGAKSKHLADYALDLAGPTQLVVYDQDPPADAAPAGVKQVIVLATSEDIRRKNAAAQQKADARADANYDKCSKAVPPKGEKPAAGKTKSDGKWTCVLGGGATGTDYVNLVQLADGGITATITGTDRNVTWEGAVVADEVHFRFAGQEASGGRLKLDPGGRAMKGNGYTFTKGGGCISWTMTCTK